MQKKDTTILIFSPAFAANEQDNWLPWLQNTVMAMNTNFPELKIIVFSFKYPYRSCTYQWKNNEVISFGSKRENKILTLYKWLKIFIAFYKKRRSNNIIGILSIWCGECAYIAKYCSRLFGIKHFCWIAGQDARAGNRYVERIGPKSGQLIAVSQFLQSEFHKNYKIRPAHVIPIGVNTALYGSKIPKKRIDILGVGSLSRLKRYDIFVDVVGKIKKAVPGINAMLCGDGEEKDELLKQIDALALQQTISLTGAIDHSTVIDKMEQSKILLHTSSYEGFGSIYLEALYAGAYVIGFTKAMDIDIENWFIVKTQQEMAEKAIQLLTDTNTLYKRVLYQTFDNTAKELVALFL